MCIRDRESTDPGLNTSHTTVHHEMDQQYHNHIYPMISRVYEKDLLLLGLWHRHPGSFNKFSADDNKTNSEYAKVIENGALSFLINLASETQLTCYYLDYCDTRAYFQPKVEICLLYTSFEQKTQRFSLLLNELEACTDYRTRVMLLILIAMEEREEGFQAAMHTILKKNMLPDVDQ